MRKKTILSVVIPVRTQSESNLREHWSKSAKRARIQRQAARWIVRDAMLRSMLFRTVPPFFQGQENLTIRITRLAPRFFDGDNSVGSAKHLRDGIADALCVDDGDPRVTWHYSQEKTKAKECGVRVEIEREGL